MKVVICKYRFAVLGSFLAVFGCSSLTPLENFQDHLQANVGKKRETYPASWHDPARLIDTVTLPNGNTEYKYLNSKRNSCVYVLVVESETNLILATRTEGEKGDCYLPP